MPSITINFSAAHAARIQTALETRLILIDENGDPRAANVQDLKDFVVAKVQQFVQSSERDAARQAADESVIPVDIT